MKRDMWEFFEAVDGRLSMTRLMVFLTWPAATWVVLMDKDQLVNYLGAYVGGYAIGKGADAFRKGSYATTHETLETGGGGDTGAVADDSGPDGGGVSGQGKPAGAGKRRAY